MNVKHAVKGRPGYKKKPNDRNCPNYSSYVSGFPLNVCFISYIYVCHLFRLYPAFPLCHRYADHLYLDSNSMVIYVCIRIVLCSSVSTAQNLLNMNKGINQ